MSTPTPDSQNQQVQLPVVERVSNRQKGLSGREWLLIVQVFVSGAVSMMVEMAALRLLPLYFGDTLLATSTLISLILLYLSVGYAVGGYYADRFPRTRLFYVLTGLAALFVALIPLIATPILHWSQQTFVPDAPLRVFIGALLAVVAIFAVPTILLGCTSPFSIRLCVSAIGSAGQTAGRLYAISTIGGLVGTFFAVLVTLPNAGTNWTLLIGAALLLLVALLGLIFIKRDVERS